MPSSSTACASRARRAPGAALVPVALALGEELHSSGSDVLAAIVAGCEVMFASAPRRGIAASRSVFTRPAHRTFGAAVVAARLLRLDSDRLCEALVLPARCAAACSRSPRPATRHGQAIASWARRRVRDPRGAPGGNRLEGPDTILEGAFGFLDTYCSESDPPSHRGTRRALGNPQPVHQALPCHVTAHTPVESVRALRDEHHIAADDVSAIRVRASAKVVSHHAAHEAAT